MLEESDNHATKDGVATESEASLVELALMFDLTEEEIEKIGESAEVVRDLPGEENPLAAVTSSSLLAVEGESSKVVQGGGDLRSQEAGHTAVVNPMGRLESSDANGVVGTHHMVWNKVGAVQPDVARDRMAQRADFKKLLELSASKGQGVESTALEEVVDSRHPPTDRFALVPVEGAMERAMREPGLFGRPLGAARLKTEFLGAAPIGPLPDTPVMASVGDLFSGEPVSPDSELELASDSDSELAADSELDEVPPAAISFPVWADSVPLRAGIRAVRPPNPWQPSMAEEEPGQLLQSADAVHRAESGARFFGRSARPGAYAVDDVEPFDLQHVALITEGHASRDVFRKSGNLGEEIIVRLTFPPKQAADLHGPKTESANPVAEGIPERSFSPETLVSFFAQSVAKEPEEAVMSEDVAVLEETPAEAVTPDATMPWADVGGDVAGLSTVPVWPDEAESLVQRDAVVQPDETVSAGLDGVEPFDLAVVKRVVRNRLASVEAEGYGDESTTSKARQVEWDLNPWESEPLPVAPNAAWPIYMVDPEARPARDMTSALDSVEPFNVERVKSVLQAYRRPVKGERSVDPQVESSASKVRIAEWVAADPWVSEPASEPVAEVDEVANVARAAEAARLARAARAAEAKRIAEAARAAEAARIAEAARVVEAARLLQQDAELAFRSERVEPFELGHILFLARAQMAQEASAPPAFVLDENPWNFDQLPAGDTSVSPNPVARPVERSVLKLEVKTSKVAPKSEEVRPVVAPRVTVAPRPVVPTPAGMRVEVRGARVVASTGRTPSMESLSAGSTVTAAEMALLEAIRESARLASESANIVRESAVLAVESANAVRRAVQSPHTDMVAVRPAVSVRDLPSPVAPIKAVVRSEERVVVPVEKLFSGISNALGDVVGSMVGHRLPK